MLSSHERKDGLCIVAQFMNAIGLLIAYTPLLKYSINYNITHVKSKRKKMKRSEKGIAAKQEGAIRHQLPSKVRGLDTARSHDTMLP